MVVEVVWLMLSLFDGLVCVPFADVAVVVDVVVVLSIVFVPACVGRELFVRCCRWYCCVLVHVFFCVDVDAGVSYINSLNPLGLDFILIVVCVC